MKFVEIKSDQNGILKRVKEAKEGLIAGLDSVEHAEGWADPTAEGAQSFWTSVEVLKSLIESNVFPGNMDSLLESLRQTQIRVNNLVGWEYEGIPQRVSVYVTGDVIRLLLAMRNYTSLEEIVTSLQRIQNSDGGWGVCEGDSISKVRSSSWVLSVLLACLNHPPAEEFVDSSVVEKGLRWLYIAQNDSAEDGGWGNLPDTFPSNVSATAFALDALIESLHYRISHPDGALSVKRDAINRGMKTLIALRKNDSWRGVKEEFAIQVDGNVLGRHVIGGAGSTSVAQVLIKAHMYGLYDRPQDWLYEAVIEVAGKCNEYQNRAGKWLVPADDGGPPLTWNSAYALDAFRLFETYYTGAIAEKWIDYELAKSMRRREKIWQRVSLALIVAIIGIMVAPYFSSLGNISSWFASQPVLLQGLILMIVTLLFERTYDLLARHIPVKRNKRGRN